MGLRDGPQVLYIFGNLINRRNNLGGKVLVPIFFRVKKTHFFQKKGENGRFLRKNSYFRPQKRLGTKTFPPSLFLLLIRFPKMYNTWGLSLKPTEAPKAFWFPVNRKNQDFHQFPSDFRISVVVARVIQYPNFLEAHKIWTRWARDLIFFFKWPSWIAGTGLLTLGPIWWL